MLQNEKLLQSSKQLLKNVTKIITACNRNLVEVHKCHARNQTFQEKFCMISQCSCLIEATHYRNQPKNNQEQNFLDQILNSISFIFIALWIREIEKKIRN